MMKCKKIIPVLMLVMLATGCQGNTPSASNPHPSVPNSEPQVSLPTPSEDDPTGNQPEPSIFDSDPGAEIEGPWI